MSLSREYTMTINKKTSVLNKNLTISTNDKGIDINTDTIKKMNENKDLIDKLKVYAEDIQEVISDIC